MTKRVRFRPEMTDAGWSDEALLTHIGLHPTPELYGQEEYQEILEHHLASLSQGRRLAVSVGMEVGEAQEDDPCCYRIALAQYGGGCTFPAPRAWFEEVMG